MGRQRMDVRPPDGFYDLPKDEQLEWIEAFIAEASARMDAMPDDEGSANR